MKGLHQAPTRIHFARHGFLYHGEGKGGDARVADATHQAMVVRVPETTIDRATRSSTSTALRAEHEPEHDAPIDSNETIA